MTDKKLPRGIRNNNPLNLRISNSPWLGKVANNTDGQFEQFTSMSYGIRAAFLNVRTIIKRHPGCTVERLIHVWAPPCENNTSAYVGEVCKLARVAPFKRLDFKVKNEMCRLLWAMAQVENGEEITFGYFENAYEMV